jgi:hypothetical protein
MSLKTIYFILLLIVSCVLIGNSKVSVQLKLNIKSKLKDDVASDDGAEPQEVNSEDKVIPPPKPSSDLVIIPFDPVTPDATDIVPTVPAHPLIPDAITPETSHATDPEIPPATEQLTQVLTTNPAVNDSNTKDENSDDEKSQNSDDQDDQDDDEENSDQQDETLTKKEEENAYQEFKIFCQEEQDILDDVVSDEVPSDDLSREERHPDLTSLIQVKKNKVNLRNYKYLVKESNGDKPIIETELSHKLKSIKKQVILK